MDLGYDLFQSLQSQSQWVPALEQVVLVEHGQPLKIDVSVESYSEQVNRKGVCMVTIVCIGWWW